MHKQALSIAIAGALVAPLMAQADVTISGQVSRALTVSDVEGVDPTVGDSGNASTRFQLRASSDDEMDGLTAGMRIEIGADRAKGTADKNELYFRHRNVWLRGAFGEVKLGHTSEAADFVSYQDKSGVYVGHGRAGADYTYTFGGGRSSGIHYQTPEIGGASALLSLANDDRMSATFQVGNGADEAPALSYKAAIGYLDANDVAIPFTGLAAAIGLKHESGLTASLSVGSKVFDDDSMEDANYAQGILGYVIGPSAVAVGMYDADPDISVLGIGVTHKLNAGLNLFATAHSSDDGKVNGDTSKFHIGATYAF